MHAVLNMRLGGLRLGLLAWLALVAAACACACACRAMPAERQPGNLLHGMIAREVVGIDHAERISDGITPLDGDPWLTDLSATFERGDGSVVFDLGRLTPIAAALVQGDNNDVFVLEVSDDGNRYRELWRAPAVAGAGMRPRFANSLVAQGRYLRVRAYGGDAYVSIGELMLFASAPEVWPPVLRHRRGAAPQLPGEDTSFALCAAGVLLLLLGLRRAPRSALAAGVALALGATAWWAREMFTLWPIDQNLVAIHRALIALVAVVAGWIWTLGPKRMRPRVPIAVLAVLSVIAVATFYNYGRPWFWNYAERRPTPVHTFDMRVYFPVAKYFDELGFDGVYLASVKAYLEGEKLPHNAVTNVELRDLRNNRMVRARDVLPQIDAVSQRFSPERWREFIEDMRFFWRTMGPGDYLGSLRDHGGNATPVWLAIANLMFRNASANELSLTLAGLLDPLLLLLTFVCIARSFGLRAMLMCMVVFGATDFPMFGSDWAGATLRFDWMATLGLGCCAFKTGRLALGGVLLAHAGLARAFPALALAFAPMPVVWFVLERLWRQRDVPVRAVLLSLRPQLRSLGRLLAGATVAIALLVGLSSVLFGFSRAWGGWLQKIAVHTEDPNTNHVGVRTAMAFDPDLVSNKVVRPELPEPWEPWQQTQLSTYQHHKLRALLLRIAFTLLCLLACRGASLEHAALLGSLLIPVLFYPANYYCQYVFLLPILAVGQQRWLGFFLEFVLLAMCSAQYFTLNQMVDVRFFWESVILLVGYAALVVPLAVVGLRRAQGVALGTSH